MVHPGLEASRHASRLCYVRLYLPIPNPHEGQRTMSLSAKILMLSQWQALGLILGVMMVLSLLGFYLTHRLMPLRVRMIHNEVAGFVFAAIAAIYGVLLAFVVIVVWEQFHQTRVNTQHEASLALRLYYEMGIVDEEKALTQLRDGLMNYLHDVVEKEYPAMAAMQPPPPAAQGLVSLWGSLKSLTPRTTQEEKLYEELLDNLGELSRLRAQRLDDAIEELPGIIWVGLIGGAIISLVFTFILGTENIRIHAVMIALLAALIGLIFHVVIQLDHPFLGSVSISPEVFQEVIEIGAAGR